MRSSSSLDITNGVSARASACVALVAGLVLAAAAAAQVTPAPAPPAPAAQERLMRELLESHGDPLRDAFFAPEVVMRYQQTIGLTADQRATIVSAISAAQPRFIEAQWQLQPETAALAEMLRGPQVDEQAVLQQIDRVLDIERQIKRIQIEMLVRIKNQLTADQQQQLTRLGGSRGLGLGSEGLEIGPRRSIFGGELHDPYVDWGGYFEDVAYPGGWSGFPEAALLRRYGVGSGSLDW